LNLPFTIHKLQFTLFKLRFTIQKLQLAIHYLQKIHFHRHLSLPRHKPGGSLIFYFPRPAFKTDQNLRNFYNLKISYFSFLLASLVLPHSHLLLHFELLKMTQPTYSELLPFNALPMFSPETNP